MPPNGPRPSKGLDGSPHLYMSIQGKGGQANADFWGKKQKTVKFVSESFPFPPV
jgi:hypothetical protein